MSSEADHQKRKFASVALKGVEESALRNGFAISLVHSAPLFVHNLKFEGEIEMKTVSRSLAASLLLTFASLTVVAQNTTFNMVRSAGASAANCIPEARGRVTINSLGNVEVMHLEASGLPPKTEFDAFIIQLPNSPFGLSWYQGDLTTDEHGKGVADFIGRFSVETFIVAPGSGPAPVCMTRVHSQMQA